MPLISTKKFIEYRDWNKLVVETYGKPYSLQQQNGCMDRGNVYINVPNDFDDEQYQHEEIPLKINGEKRGVKFDVWLKTNPNDHKEIMKWDDFYVGLFWTRNFYPSLDTLANDLYKKGLIEAGKYCINIDW